jgi:hypothetical protein
MSTNQTLEERYGRKATTRQTRIRIGILAGALVSVFLGWAIWVSFFTTPAPKASVVGYDVIDDQHTQVRFTVSKPADKSATCEVRVLSNSYGVVGYLEVPVPADTPSNRILEVSVNTTQLGVTGVVDRCWLG